MQTVRVMLSVQLHAGARKCANACVQEAALAAAVLPESAQHALHSHTPSRQATWQGCTHQYTMT